MALRLPKLSPWRPKGCHLAGLFSIRVHTAATSFVFRWRSLHAGLLGLAGLTLTLDVYLTWSLNFRIVVRSKVFARRTIDMKKAMLKKRSAASNFGKQSAARVRTQISFCLIAIIGLQIAVAGQQGSPEAQNVFRSPDKSKSYTTPELLAAFEAGDDEYTLGEGDEITVEVWDHPELSGRQTVGPDGRITLSQAGPVKVTDLSRDGAAKSIRESYSGSGPTTHTLVTTQGSWLR